MITIRKALADDMLAIWQVRRDAIYKGCMGFYPDATLNTWAEVPPSDEFKKKVASECHVAMVDSQIAGMGMLNLQSGKVDAMFVSPQHMGRGIGKKMLSHLENLAREAGVPMLYLDASLNAVPFYRVCGFSGELAGKYQSTAGFVLDCVKMQKALV